MHKRKTFIKNKPYFIKLNEIREYDIATSLEFFFAEYFFKNSYL